jgi:hypothetical protein
MAYTKFTVTNGIEIKEVPLGFSWTTLFFGFFPSLIRGDYMMFVVILLLQLITSGISGIVFAFIYNKMYAKSLLMKGWQVSHLPVPMTEEKLAQALGLVALP